MNVGSKNRLKLLASVFSGVLRGLTRGIRGEAQTSSFWAPLRPGRVRAASLRLGIGGCKEKSVAEGGSCFEIVFSAIRSLGRHQLCVSAL